MHLEPSVWMHGAHARIGWSGGFPEEHGIWAADCQIVLERRLWPNRRVVLARCWSRESQGQGLFREGRESQGQELGSTPWLEPQGLSCEGRESQGQERLFREGPGQRGPGPGLGYGEEEPGEEEPSGNEPRGEASGKSSEQEEGQDSDDGHQ